MANFFSYMLIPITLGLLPLFLFLTFAKKKNKLNSGINISILCTIVFFAFLTQQKQIETIDLTVNYINFIIALGIIFEFFLRQSSILRKED